MKFSIKDSFSKCDQIRRKLRICSHLLKKSLMETFLFCAVFIQALFSHIQPYLEPHVTLTYAEIWHFWNPGMFRTLP